MQGPRGLKEDTCTQDPKGVKGDKGVFDTNDAVNKSYVDNDSHFTLQGFKLTFIVDGTYKFHNWDG